MHEISSKHFLVANTHEQLLFFLFWSTTTKTTKNEEENYDRMNEK